MEHDLGLSEAYTIIDPGLYLKNYILLDTDSGIDIFWKFTIEKSLPFTVDRILTIFVMK